PKDPTPNYTFQCSISVLDELVYRRAFGGKIWHEAPIYVVMRLRGDPDWYSASQTIINVSDVFHVVVQRHAELPDAAVVQAAKNAGKGSAP
ncbi:hypothetical protein ACI4BF_28080, partial [Klebsiella pneumoniae]|uniref:hypothetical protein n=1 Tax=Klebsiella pneumoniae TaxID=573 RepID=UPI003853188E